MRAIKQPLLDYELLLRRQDFVEAFFLETIFTNDIRDSLRSALISVFPSSTPSLDLAFTLLVLGR